MNFETLRVILLLLGGMILGIGLMIYENFRTAREDSWENAWEYPTYARVLQRISWGNHYSVIVEVQKTLHYVEILDPAIWEMISTNGNLYVSYKMTRRSGQIGQVQLATYIPSCFAPKPLISSTRPGLKIFYLPGSEQNVH